MNSDRLRVMGVAWLGVYPSVCIMSYILEPLDLPIVLSTLISTLLTVPLITFVVIPYGKRAIARMDDRSTEDLDA